MLGSVSTRKIDDHTVLGGELGRYVERLAKESGRDLFLMRYNKLGVFCICEWMSPNRDIFIDLMNLGKSLGNFTREKNTELLQRLFKPLTCDTTSQLLAQADSDYHHLRQDENEEEGERLAKCAIGE
jgi:hypothetical protein